MELLNTGTYLLLIDEEAEIKEGDYYHYFMTPSHPVIRHKLYSNDIKMGITKPGGDVAKIIAYYPLAKDAKELDLPCLPDPFEEEDDVEELAKIKFAVDIPSKFTAAQIWMDGYKAAQSSNKQFSLEDIERAMIEGLTIEQFWEKYVLSTQQFPKEFVPKYVNEPIYTGDGCHEDNWIFKTITNSQGKEILQGKYIW